MKQMTSHRKTSVKAIILMAVFLTVLVLIDIFAINSIVDNTFTNHYLIKFVEYSKSAVSWWEKYESSKNIMDYQRGVVRYGIAIDYYDQYFHCFSNRSYREYFALYAVYNDMLNNMEYPPSYFSRFIYLLSLFDYDYKYGSDELFLEIYNIQNTIENRS